MNDIPENDIFIPGACAESFPVANHAPSLLPKGRDFTLVWNDEFDGDALDEAKWSYRTTFWGRKAHWFATPEDGAVEVKDGCCSLKLVRRPDGQFVSPQLQTGELIWDIPHEESPAGFWPLPKREPPKFTHRYGFYECRCRLQQMEDWWSAFWMQTPTQGCSLDPRRAGVEHDIMESFIPGEVVPHWFHANGYGADWLGFASPRKPEGADIEAFNRAHSLKLDKTVFHHFGFLWEPDGYTFFVDGAQHGPKVGCGPGEAVSQIEEFILISTEAQYYRQGHMTGKGAPGLAAAAAAGDDFLIDYVRVFDVTVNKTGTPCLQAPSETSMGVSWAVSGLSKGVVEIADNPEFENTRTAKGTGSGLVPIDDAALQVRITGLKPATRYWYRTVTTPFTSYPNCYQATLGKPVVSAIHSFTTPGLSARGHFCMISDTHASWPAYRLVCRKLKSLAPEAVIWNGDAAGSSTQSKREAVEAFLDQPVEDADWEADIPAFFVCGNHDVRGNWPSRLGEVMLPRDPSERRGDQWDLAWNFAVRLGDLALVGLDTGEDKPDAHPKWFGLAAFEPYRRKQAAWLAETLARPDIASAPFKVVFCHIPLFAAPDHRDYPHDGVAIDPNDYAYWSRECSELWGPLITGAGVQLVACGHKHRFRYDSPTPDRPWAQVIGGGPELGIVRGKPDDELFPTVVEGKVEDGRLRLVVHDVLHDRIVLDERIDPLSR